jgi:Domain of unknown function (DUF4129)
VITTEDGRRRKGFYYNYSKRTVPGGREALVKTRLAGSGYAAVAAAALLLAIAAAATPDDLFLPGSPAARRVVVPDPPVLLGYVILVLGVGIAIAYLFVRVSIRAGGRSGTTRFRSLATLFVFLALWATFPGFQRAVTRVLESVTGERQQISENQPQERATPVERDPSQLYGYVLTSIVLVGLVVVAAALVALNRRTPVDEPSSPDPELLEQMEAGVDDLKGIADPRAAVIACYARLQTFATRGGVSSRRSDTPLELLQKLLVKEGVSGSAAADLTTLFEQAKFSHHRIDEKMRSRALKALTKLRDQLEMAR